LKGAINPPKNMPQRIQAKDIEPELKRLIAEARPVEPGLAHRLDEMRRWIRAKKPGQLMSKRHVMDFLVELYVDARVWLDLQALESEARQACIDQMTPAERYWYTELFPRWFNEPDPKLSIWKQKLMAGEFDQEDKELIDSLCHCLEQRQGSSWACYILDLSMATDLLASGTLKIPLSVQLTTLSSQLSVDKKARWELTLRYWKIQRALFVSFNPMRDSTLLESRILQESDRLPASCYTEVEI
jgi:hypothetical protein